MMDSPITNPDRAAIEAVKHGDRDRFAELVERHQRMVYGIAWSYLGDADLCDDAAQETFIKAFRYLGALRDAERFPAWLSKIARNVSATLLRRRRSDLAGRRRWQAEQPDEAAAAPQPAAESDENLKEMLGRTLSELPPQLRECLVLFYLEGKSIREAAEILGLSEVAVKTRLHRARCALRGRLEEQIERNLRGLAPRKDFAASVMVLLPAKPLGIVGAGGGASLLSKAGGWLLGLFPMMIFALWMTVGQAGFSYLIMSWYMRMEAANIVDKPENAFRKTLLRRQALTMSLGVLCVFIFIVFAMSHFSLFTYFQILAIYCLWGFYQSIVRLRVNRSGFAYGQVLANSLFLLVSVLIGFFGAPVGLVFVVIFLMNLMLPRANRTAPRRHDYNLFLRAANGILGEPGSERPSGRVATEPELRGFARFLGEQWLITDYALSGATLLLRLPAVRMTVLNSLLGTFAGRSTVMIQSDGTCNATMSPTDAKLLSTLLKHPIDIRALEDGVGRVIKNAFAFFLNGQHTEARKLLSTLEDEAIFVTDFSKTKAYRLQHRIALIASLALLIGFSFLPGIWSNSALVWGLAWGDKPVSQAMAQQAVSEWIRGDRSGARADLLYLWGCPAHPSLSLIGKENAAGYKRLVTKELQMDFDERNEGALNARIINGIINPDLLYIAMSTPILPSEELAQIGFDPARVREALALRERDPKANMTPVREMLFQIPKKWFDRKMGVIFPTVPELRRFDTLDIETFAKRLWILKQFDCLDFIDRETIAKQIAAHQVSPDFRIPTNWSPIDLKEAAGLFDFGMCSLRETWAGLFALDTLGRLDLIDREACIRGTLRFYRGKGVFRADADSGVSIHGNENDAFYAMESLSRLNGLDRIPDFGKWKFHPMTQAAMVDGRVQPRKVTGEALQSWAYEERLERLRAK
ncbi:sigma-70 family RNA polymerase sigma factor [bacterium]|nr:sigma-70 family RNA polymerase sigma factor [bacterium]